MKKQEKYKLERIDILNKIKNLLNNKNIFYLNEIDEDTKIQICNLKDQIGSYFVCKDKLPFLNKQSDNIFLSLIKIVFKQNGYKMISTRKTMKINDKMIKTTGYVIMDN
jgi:hypothetical protein